MKEISLISLLLLQGAAGGFQHGQHLGFNQEDNHPIGTLYVSMLQRLGLETDRFGSATSAMRGLELI